MVEEFHIEQVHDLVDGALGAPSIPAPGPGLDTQEISLLGIFYTSLNEGGVTVDTRQRIMAQLNDHLKRWVASPSPTKLAKLVSGCRSCPDASPGSGQMLVGNTKNPEWVFVMENPSDNLSALRSAITEAGFDLAKVGVTYLTRCRFSSRPDRAAVYNCSGYLLDELHYYQPRIVVPVGSTPAKALLGGDLSISKAHGQSYWIDSLHVIPLLSPTHAERSNQLSGLKRDLEYILTVA